MGIEVWKDISGHEEVYQVSNLGRIRNKKRNLIRKKQIDRNGYERIMIKDKLLYVHRIVAETFIENNKGLPEINHKDENKLNNNVENLEWCTRTYNNNYGNRISKIRNKLGKKIVQLDKKGNFIKEWESANMAAQYYKNTHIIDCLKRKKTYCIRL